MSRKQPPVTESKPIALIMSIKSNDDLRSYLEQRPDLNLSLMREKNDSTLVHFAAFKNELSKLRIYVQHYQAFHKRSRHASAFEGQLKAWLNHPNSDGLTPLHFAALHGNTEMLDFLERHGANMMAVSTERENALFMAVQNNHLKAVVYLLEHRDGRPPYNPNEANHLGDTILHKAAKHGFTNLVAYMLACSDIDSDARNLQGWTPLMYAVSGGHKEIVKRMLLKGVNRQLANLEEKRAIDLARDLGRGDLVRVLEDEFGNCDRIKIACNLKVVYQVERPSLKQPILFLVLFHLLFLPTHVLVEVDLFGDDSFAFFLAIAGLYYIAIMGLFCSLTRKHPRKRQRDLMQVELPCCPECKSSLRSNEFHCFICGVCVSRYDHHCPWINNCVSGYNIGRFTLWVALLILGSIEVLFISVTFYFNALSVLAPARWLSLPQGDSNKYYLTNMVVSGLLGCLFCLLLFSLLGDQLKNLFTNTTSYERARSLRKSSLLDSDAKPNSSIAGSQLDDQEEDEERGCLSNCRAMLGEKYQQDSD